MMTYLVTGAAGFIGMHVAETLLRQGHRVVGIDSFVPYYDLRLKEQRWQRLEGMSGFTGLRMDLADAATYEALKAEGPFTSVVHLAAQAGVRYARENPALYVDANVKATTLLLDFVAKNCPETKMLYASSSSVYGRNEKVPFSEADAVERPASLYAATKRACELIADVYHHLYKLDLTGLRFFTVYGPWGRPDMAYWQFTDAILKGEAITLFENGAHRRDFTYIDDIVAGIMGILGRKTEQPEHTVYNLGNNQPVVVREMLSILETQLGKAAIIHPKPAGKDEVDVTYADIDKAGRDFGFKPVTQLADGLASFLDWYRPYREQVA